MPLQFGITLKEAKAGFFDRKAVIAQMDEVTRLALEKFGAWVMVRARHSIRERNKISAPGKPPNSHTGLLRNNIMFSYDAATKSVVIGPTKLNKDEGIPRLLEDGGTATRRFIVLPKEQLKKPPRPTRNNRRPKWRRKLARAAKAMRSWWTNTLWGASAKKTPAKFNPYPNTILLYSASAPPRQVTYRPRPYMGPAYNATKRKLYGG